MRASKKRHLNISPVRKVKKSRVDTRRFQQPEPKPLTFVNWTKLAALGLPGRMCQLPPLQAVCFLLPPQTSLSADLIHSDPRPPPAQIEVYKNDLSEYRKAVNKRPKAPTMNTFLHKVRHWSVTIPELLRYRRFFGLLSRPPLATPSVGADAGLVEVGAGLVEADTGLVEVSREEVLQLQRLFESAETSGQTVVAQVEGNELTKNDLVCLKPMEWLNDEVINAYMALLNQRSIRMSNEKSALPKAYHWSTFFYSSLTGETSQGHTEYSYDRVRRWTTRKKIDIFSYDLIFIPIHVNKMHWALGSIDLRSKLIFFFDSLGGEVGDDYFETLMRYLKDEHLDKKGFPLDESESWYFAGNNFSLSLMMPEDIFRQVTISDAGPKTTTLNVNIPLQDNGSDCGVFTCQYAESLGVLRFPFQFTATDIRTRRMKMALQILAGHVQ